MNSTQAWLWLGLILIAGTLTKWLYTGFKIRCHVSQLRKQGLAMPPWSWLYGHLSFMRTTLKQYPPDILFSVVINDIYHKNFESSGLFYLDLWPFARPTLVVCNAASSLEVNRRLNTKPDEYKAIFSPQTNGPSLLNTNGKEWKVWRRSMNPGFAISNLMQAECVKNIIESIEVFCDILSNKARQGNVSPLEDSVSRCTLEVILRTATNIKSNYQRVNNNGIDAVRCLMSLISVEGLLQQYNPVRFLKIAYYNRIINRHFGEMLQHCIDSSIDSSNSKHSVFSTARTFHSDKCKAQFIQGAVPQIRMLLIAGNETTSSTLIYAYHLLHKNPSARTRLIEEHNRVFGNLSNTSKALSSTSAFKLLNQIHYTHAVIKETLRISLPTGAVRDGCPNTSLIDANGLHYPTEGCMVSLAHLAIHTNPRSYSEAGNFKPERWLEDHEDVERGAFRPFERGARDCLGQNLAVLQLKIALLMTVRRFAIVPAYEEWDEIQKKNISFDSFVRGRLLGRNVDAKKEVDGERAYHVEKDGGAHPKAGYPCRVQLLADEKSCSAHLAVSGQE